MARKVRHIHARPNEYIKVHRKHKESDNTAFGILMIAGIILFCIFWKEILLFLSIAAVIGTVGWICWKFHKEIFEGIILACEGIYACCSWIYSKIAGWLKKKNKSISENLDAANLEAEDIYDL